jgi:hypothetical protein
MNTNKSGESPTSGGLKMISKTTQTTLSSSVSVIDIQHHLPSTPPLDWDTLLDLISSAK